jgi:ribosome-associated heat shock protein Hsp15
MGYGGSLRIYTAAYICAMAEAPEKLRIDKYLWSIRLFKTRSQAADACDKGRVKLNDTSVKASRVVKIDDVYDVKTEARKWIVKVTGLLDHRVAYSEAVKYYTDLTPPELLEKNDLQVASFFTGKRLSKTGRPTKEQRRNMDQQQEDTKGDD